MVVKHLRTKFHCKISFMASNFKIFCEFLFVCSTFSLRFFQTVHLFSSLLDGNFYIKLPVSSFFSLISNTFSSETSRSLRSFVPPIIETSSTCLLLRSFTTF